MGYYQIPKGTTAVQGIPIGRLNSLQQQINSGGAHIDTVTGTINSSNKIFTVPNTIISPIVLFLAGEPYQPVIDFTTSGTTITFITAPDISLAGQPFWLIHGVSLGTVSLASNSSFSGNGSSGSPFALTGTINGNTIETQNNKGQNNGYFGLDASGNAVGIIIGRTGTAASLASLVLQTGEIAWATDTKIFLVGDGSTAGGNPIPNYPLNGPIVSPLNELDSTNIDIITFGADNDQQFQGVPNIIGWDGSNWQIVLQDQNRATFLSLQVANLSASSLTSPLLVLTPQYATPTTGTTVNATSSKVILQPAGTLAALTVNLPVVSNGTVVRVSSTQILTSLTITATNSPTIIGAPTSLTANGFFEFTYRTTGTTWFRTG